jgi:hypothetical protein
MIGFTRAEGARALEATVGATEETRKPDKSLLKISLKSLSNARRIT